MPRILGSKKEKASFVCFQQALENGTTFKINKRKTQVLSRTQLQRIFCHLSVRKAISNTDMQSILTVHLDVKQRTVNLDVKQRTEKVENLIFWSARSDFFATKAPQVGPERTHETKMLKNNLFFIVFHMPKSDFRLLSIDQGSRGSKGRVGGGGKNAV